MKTKSILVSFVSSLLATTILQVAQAREISISSVSDGTYSFWLGHPSDLSPDYYFDFRKTGNRVVGIQYASGGPVGGIDGVHYWERTCVEGTIVGNKIIGTGVVTNTEGKTVKISSRSHVVDWQSNPKRDSLQGGYSIKMTNGRVLSNEKIREYPGYFAVGYMYGKATLSFYAHNPADRDGDKESFSKIDSQRILLIKSILVDLSIQIIGWLMPTLLARSLESVETTLAQGILYNSTTIKNI
jgi:hypothetical protein